VVEQVTLATTAPTYLTQDQLGSTRVLTDQAGTVVGTATYGPYGAETSHTGAATSPIGYAGGWTTTATGLSYLVARDYTPSTTSFTSVDPLVATTTAPYGYGAEDPVDVTDPSGQCVTIFGVACLGGGSVTSKVHLGFHPEAGLQAVENFGAGLIGHSPIGTQCNPLENIPYYAGVAFPFAAALVGGAVSDTVQTGSEDEQPGTPPDEGLTGASDQPNPEGGDRSTAPVPGAAPNWPPDSGFTGPHGPEPLAQGTLIGRYGAPTGSNASLEGTPFAELSLPPYYEDTRPYYVYEVVGPVSPDTGRVAPWFGEPGGGTQFLFDRPMITLVSDGTLRVVKVVDPN
jgi:RHS repeat-associated protein